MRAVNAGSGGGSRRLGVHRRVEISPVPLKEPEQDRMDEGKDLGLSRPKTQFQMPVTPGRT